MSWKSKLKSVGVFAVKYVVTAGIGALVDHYASRRVAAAVKDILGAALEQRPASPALQKQINDYLSTTGPDLAHEVERLRATLGPIVDRGRQ